MAWDFNRAKNRIASHKETVPFFDEKITLAEQARNVAMAKSSGLLDGVSPRRAFVVEGAHLYGHIVNYDQLVADSSNNETEASHAVLLSFLDAQYQLWDAIVEGHDSDRVDYHGSRLHAVVTEPAGNPIGQVQRAIALAKTLTDATRQIAARFNLPIGLRFGIDQGKCLAMTTGRGHERDTLFLGAPANHAAKLAAASIQTGIYLVPRAAAALRKMDLAVAASLANNVSESEIASSEQQFQFESITRAALRIASSQKKQFNFFTPTLPLSSLRFENLTASHTARLQAASLFADIDGFTKFVDRAISMGSEATKSAAAAIHVIREELNDVLKLDFGGKRIRFIGDCIHGALASDVPKNTASASVREATICATGMMSSFNLCKEQLSGIDELGLAIGIELGQTSITRLGNSGEESIRCAAGKAVVGSEIVQQQITGSNIALGPVANLVADNRVKSLLENSVQIPEYDSAIDLLAEKTSPAFSIMSRDQASRPHLSSKDTK